MIIPSETFEEIRFEANYEIYENILMDIDPARFRGLGEKGREAFIRHATARCDSWELPFISDVTYVMFVMNFLGSFFYEDIRHSYIAEHLSTIPEMADNRISVMRERFILFGDRFIGEGLALYHQDLRRFRQTLLPEIDRYTPSEALSLLARCHGDRSYDLSQRQHTALMRHAEVGARRLKLGGEGLLVSVVLCYWLGSGFWKDPLYPWIAEMASVGGTSRLRDYAIHRLEKDLGKV